MKYLAQIIIILLVLSVGIGCYFLVGKSLENAKEISQYSKGLISDDNIIDVNEVYEGGFTLIIGGLNVEGNTIATIQKKLQSIEIGNKNRNIFLDILFDTELKKSIQYKYVDFGYKIDITGILAQVKHSIIIGESKVSLDLNNYIFFDDKLLSKKIGKMKDLFSHDKRGEIIYIEENNKFELVDSDSILSYYEDIEYGIKDIEKKLSQKDAKIRINFRTEENVLLTVIDGLNAISKVIKKLDIEVSGHENGISKNISLDYFDSLGLSKVKLNINEEGLYKFIFTGGFLLDHLVYNKETNSLSLNEKSFDNTYESLSSFEMGMLDDQLLYKPSILKIKPGGISENYPIASDIQILTYGVSPRFDYNSFKRALKVLIPKLDVTTNTQNSYLLHNMWISQAVVKPNKLKISIIDKALVKKEGYDFTVGIKENKSLLYSTEFNYSDYPITLSEKESGYNSCFIERNNRLICGEDNIYIGYFEVYNETTYILKEVHENLVKYLDEIAGEVSMIGNDILFPANNINLYYGDRINNFSLLFPMESFIQGQLDKHIPTVLHERVSTIILNNKLSFIYDSTEKLIIKTADNLENFYLFIFEVDEA